MDAKTNEQSKNAIVTSTPSNADNGNVKRGVKRAKVRQPGSESSADGDLSYLDLDTGKILSAAREDQMILSQTDFDNLVGKIDKIQTNLDKFDKIEKSLSKLDKLDKLDAIEKTVRDMNVKLYDMDQRLRAAESSTTELQNTAQFLSAQYDSVTNQQDDQQKVLSEHSKNIQTLTSENETLKKSLVEIRDLHDQLKTQLLDSKCREMRDNLVFTNIEEVLKTSETGKQYEETEKVLNDFLSSKLNLDGCMFERVHRVPTVPDPDRDPPRPIVAKFSYFKDRESVRRSGYKLKGTSYGINEQFPEEIEKKRRELYPLAKYYRDQEKRVVLVRDRLFVDGREVRAGEIEIPPDYKRQNGAQAGSGNDRHRGQRFPNQPLGGRRQPAWQVRRTGQVRKTGQVRQVGRVQQAGGTQMTESTYL